MLVGDVLQHLEGSNEVDGLCGDVAYLGYAGNVGKGDRLKRLDGNQGGVGPLLPDLVQKSAFACAKVDQGAALRQQFVGKLQRKLVTAAVREPGQRIGAVVGLLCVTERTGHSGLIPDTRR